MSALQGATIAEPLYIQKFSKYVACDFAPCNGIESETRLQFKGMNGEYDLFIPTSRLTLTVDNSFQMKKFMDDLKGAIENGNIKATGTKADSYADFDIAP